MNELGEQKTSSCSLDNGNLPPRRLFESNIVGTVIFDLEGQLIDANDAFLDMVGYDRDDLVSRRMRWPDMTPAEWRAASRRAVADRRATATRQAIEMEYFRKDGSRVPVLVSAAALEGKREESVAFVLDLTDRKQAEANQPRGAVFQCTLPTRSDSAF